MYEEDSIRSGNETIARLKLDQRNGFNLDVRDDPFQDAHEPRPVEAAPILRHTARAQRRLYLPQGTMSPSGDER